jgi:hypothetical protein
MKYYLAVKRNAATDKPQKLAKKKKPETKKL